MDRAHRSTPHVAGIEPLPTTELAVLMHVLASPGLCVGELSRHLGMRQSNTSAAVRTLAERGLLARRLDPDDRRLTQLVPTERARVEHEAIAAAWAGPIADALAGMSPEHVAALEVAAEALQVLDRRVRARQSSRTDAHPPR
ncbi:transcriptional regulator, MarR family [Cellulomonas flavigena DSM 20109]|uniref:Transcriptional regulator, MarR family n=1 Tax=Cellulomonas flavigena (strain ATCC 482 / DSM 20109 / BCRC 11376 / JCM 18109 / NBRC 3775 / NCIMB 8073 / NRS 134) TaxID=446466 RepID=D5UCP8_CELFN|nr:MarR family transcriptional regulator [Cellulomonas flavigena]ADG76283.1 transcriptional regulator, MarR family [Cellulomonas flavigena DSM 20109]